MFQENLNPLDKVGASNPEKSLRRYRNLALVEVSQFIRNH